MKNVLGSTYGIGASEAFTGFLSSLTGAVGISARSYADEQKLLEMAGFVQALAEWKVFATFTFTWSASVDSARRCFERFVRRTLPNVSTFYAIELHPGGHGGHVHCLFDRADFPRKAVWREWKKRYGINRVEPIERGPAGFIAVCDYCAKYVLKDHAWWNFSLSRGAWHKRTVDTLHRDAGNNGGAMVLQGRTELFPPSPAAMSAS